MRLMPPTFTPDPSPSSFRKIAAAMWQVPNDPQIYGTLDIEATDLLRTLEKVRAATGVKLTITHIVARAVALVFQRYPEVNAKVRWWGKIVLRSTVDLFLQVAVEGGKDLSGVKIDEADKKSALDLAKEIADKANRIRKSDDPAYAKSRGLIGWMPWFLVRAFLRFSSFLVNELHLNLAKFGMPVDPFGTAMITNVGMFGVDTAFAPLTPIARCPMIVLVTEVKDRPWVVGKSVEVRPVLRLCATFDHRIIDGAHAGKLAAEMRELLERPEKLCEPEADSPTVKATTPVPT
jgi:pyruvate dehydrogenase E2 component (dihydrolipoamide acetyltransferase)